MKDDNRFPLGLPKADNANYLWIHFFIVHLNAKGRAGFVMANSAADARGTEMEIRKRIIQASAVDVMISIGPNFFYTVTLPCTLWFFDKGKARPIARTMCCSLMPGISTGKWIGHTALTPEQIEYIANIARLYRGESRSLSAGSKALTQGRSSRITRYQDVAGLCKVATLEKSKRKDGVSIQGAMWA